MTSKAEFFIPENAQVDRRREEMSPSGQYKLVVTPYYTTPTGWNYSQGLVFKVGCDEPIAEVQRNYGAFPALFIEGHANGQSYLVCGENYQGQTVIELDTGLRRDFLPKEAKDGAGFCWAGNRYDAASQILVVVGCHWACPYEYRFFDFSDPMSGWPEIVCEQTLIDDDQRWPTIEANGTIKCYQSEHPPEDDDEDDDTPKLQPIAATMTFKREGLKLILINEEVTDKEQTRRRESEEARKKYEQELAEYRASDPLYLAFKEQLKDPLWKKDEWEGIGITYEGWCPHFTDKERRVCRRIVDRQHNNTPYTIDLEWAARTGPVKLVIYKDGNCFEDKFFLEHSVASIQAAFNYARKLVS